MIGKVIEKREAGTPPEPERLENAGSKIGKNQIPAS
jgi:hypothetical protein